MDSKLSTWFLNVDDRIEVTVVNQSPLAYQYNNIDAYSTWGLSFSNSLTHQNLQLNLGLSFSGQRKVMESQSAYDDDYLYAIQANTSVAYSFPKINTTLSLFYKYIGPEYQFQLDNTQEETTFMRIKQEGYGWMDASVKKTFLNQKIHLTLGARNLLNVTRLHTQASGGTGVHTNANNGILLGYGKSFFLKLLYHLTI
jgi:outer membrane receptor for ferrienterochelin and colicins